MKNVLPPLIIGNLTAKLPIIQGGMGVGISLSGLASAVANEGGIGVISSVGLGLLKPEMGQNYPEANINALRAEIRKARSMTKGILGLNIMLAVTDFDEMLKTAFEEEIDIVFMGAGLFLKLPTTMTLEYLQNVKTKVGIIVSSDRAASLILNHWAKHFQLTPDIVVVEGPKAGGHLGFKLNQINDPEFALEKIIPKVKAVVKAVEDISGKHIPVIAGGGIYTGTDMYQIMQLGADGVQIGTRFVATDECDADDRFKQQFIACSKEDIVLIESPVGLPGRAINNQFLQDVADGYKHPFNCAWKCLKTCDYHNAPYCIALALRNARNGQLNDGFAFSGANGYRVDEIVSVKELIRDLITEYESCVSAKTLSD
jgi:NAD(P)H-dependent flavin oxidoreductase YrpB (nitropropane dioxygenase family)